MNWMRERKLASQIIGSKEKGNSCLFFSSLLNIDHKKKDDAQEMSQYSDFVTQKHPNALSSLLFSGKDGTFFRRVMGAPSDASGT